MRFAEAGYDAVAFDYFGRSAGTDPHPADFDQTPHLAKTTPEGIAADAAAAAAHLRGPDRDRAIAVLGFCFGGRSALLQALPDSSIQPAAVISFYGQLGPDRTGRDGPLSVADRFVRPILGHYGGADEGIPVDQVEELDRALSGARWPRPRPTERCGRRRQPDCRRRRHNPAARTNADRRGSIVSDQRGGRV